MEENVKVWRVECADGETREVRVRRDGIMWRMASGGLAYGTPLAVVAELIAWQQWPVVAVIAPGQKTREDALSAARREGAEAMREACAEKCEIVAMLHSPTARAVYAESVARAIRALPLPE